MLQKILSWLKDSNRLYHLAGGAILGLFSIGLYCAAYTGIAVSSALEFKDKQHGGKWDWIDWSITITGVAIGYSVRVVITILIF